MKRSACVLDKVTILQLKKYKSKNLTRRTHVKLPFGNEALTNLKKMKIFVHYGRYKVSSSLQNQIQTPQLFIKIILTS